MADVTRAFGNAGISLASVSQSEGGDSADAGVPVIVTTHEAREASVRSAVEAINALPSMREPAAVLRIVDMPREPGEPA